MLNLEVSRCKYPNIIAEMEVLNVDFSEMGDILHKTARETKSMLVSGRKPIYLEDLERVQSFFRVPDMGVLAKSELVTSQDGTTFKVVILGLKQEALKQLDFIEENGVELDSWQKRAAKDTYSLLEKAETSPINYAEYRRFIESGEKIEGVYKSQQRKKEMNTLAAYISEYPEDAAQKLAEMFNLMDERSKLMLFATAFHDKQVVAARKGQK
jgi:hypothetical protein